MSAPPSTQQLTLGACSGVPSLLLSMRIFMASHLQLPRHQRYDRRGAIVQAHHPALTEVRNIETVGTLQFLSTLEWLWNLQYGFICSF